jgi:alanine-glyoxylate transaminase/serine-glyoxylate transaminase/serine-pyruvate transaminase
VKELVNHSKNKYDISFDQGLGKSCRKVFCVGHLGNLKDVMLLSRIAVTEIAMLDLGFLVSLGSGVSVAQEFFRNSAE